MSTWKKNHCISILLKLNAIIFLLNSQFHSNLQVAIILTFRIDFNNDELARGTTPIQRAIVPYWKDATGLGSIVHHTKSKKNDGDGDQFVDDKPFIDKRKPSSTTVQRGVLNNGEHTLILVTARMIHSAVWNSKWLF